MTHDIDGVFGGAGDYLCVDVNGDGRLGCRDVFDDENDEIFRSGDWLTVGGRRVRMTVAVSGHRVHVEYDPREPKLGAPSRSG